MDDRIEKVFCEPVDVECVTPPQDREDALERRRVYLAALWDRFDESFQPDVLAHMIADLGYSREQVEADANYVDTHWKRGRPT